MTQNEAVFTVYNPSAHISNNEFRTESNEKLLIINKIGLLETGSHQNFYQEPEPHKNDTAPLHNKLNVTYIGSSPCCTLRIPRQGPSASPATGEPPICLFFS
jgi:hypothetical protein